MSLGQPPPITITTESQQISPNRAKNGVCVLIIWKNPDSFEIIRKIGYHLENPDSFEIIRKIGNHLEKIRTVLKPSRKLEIIWENPDCFEFESILTLCISFVSIRGLLPYLWQLSIGTFLFIAPYIQEADGSH